MYVEINGIVYNKIKSISFSPETDVLGNELPINELVSEIYTDEYIDIGQYAYLYDKNDDIWAKYWIVDVQKSSEETFTIYCQSDLRILDQKIFRADRYTNTNAKTLLEIIFSYCNLSVEVDSSFSGATVDGFFPEQTAKERVQWICFVIGGYVKTFFNDTVQIVPLSQTSNFISEDETFYAPKIEYSDYVTGIEVTSFSFSRLEPDEEPKTTDEWVYDNNLYYVVTRQTFSVTNSAITSVVPENIIRVNDLMLINSTNVNDILLRLSNSYFKRTSVVADIVNNGEFLPGDLVFLDISRYTSAQGFISSATFNFGNNAKSQIVLKQATLYEKEGSGGGSGSGGEYADENALQLTIVYKCGNDVLQRKTYFIPSGLTYKIQNPNLDFATNVERFVYLPEDKYVSGIMGNVATTVEQQYRLCLYYNDWNLHIYEVSEMTQDSETGEVTLT